MALVPAKCTMCGGQIEVDDTQEAGICKHCGTEYITEKVINNYNYTTNYNVTNNVTKIINGKETDDSEEEFNKGLTNLKLKQYDQARSCFDKAIRKSPETAKYHFYWCIADSENFTNVDVFLGRNNQTYHPKDKQESIHSIEPFFALASKQECEELSKQFGIDLTHGLSGLIDCIWEKYLNVIDECHGYHGIHHIWEHSLSKLEKGSDAYKKIIKIGRKYMYDLAIPILTELYDPYSENQLIKEHLEYSDYKTQRQCIESMVAYMTKNKLFSDSQLALYKHCQEGHYEDIFNFVSQLEDYTDEQLKKLLAQKKMAEELENSLAEAKAKKEAKKEKSDTIKLNIYISLFSAACIFILAHFICFANLPRTAENRLGEASKQAFVIAIIGAVALFIILCLWKPICNLFSNIKNKLNAKKAKKRKEKLKNKQPTQKNTLASQARKGLENKFGDAFNAISSENQKELINQEIAKIKSEQKAQNKQK